MNKRFLPLLAAWAGLGIAQQGMAYNFEVGANYSDSDLGKPETETYNVSSTYYFGGVDTGPFGAGLVGEQDQAHKRSR